MAQQNPFTVFRNADAPKTADEVKARDQLLFDAILSGHSGASAPAYVTTGTVWYNSTDKVLYLYDGSVSYSVGLARRTEKTANHTLELADIHSHIICNSGSAFTVTIPLNATVAFPVGTMINITTKGTGVITIDAVAGVTLNGVDGGNTQIQGQWGAVSLWKDTTDGWIISGLYGTIA